MKWILAFFIAVIFYIGDRAAAYSGFIGYGYTSCVTCHYNAFGNGPLNDYGRALWATEIAGRAFRSNTITDETLAEQSGFFGKNRLPYWLRPAISYRGMYYYQNPANNPQGRYITMQADFMNVIRFDKKDRFLAVATIGYAPTPRLATSGDSETSSNLISREHYFRIWLNKTFILQVGMQDKVYGLRIPDHNAFSRAETQLAQNDQAHGAALHFTKGLWEGGIEAFAGNLFQTSDLRQKGASTMVEYDVAEKFRIGGSALYSKNNYLQLGMGAFHSRLGIGKGSSFIFELGAINKKPTDGTATTNPYGLFQSLLNLGKGFYFLNTMEYDTADFPKLKTRFMRFTPGIQYFPAQRIEVRVEAMNSRAFDPDGIRRDTWDILSQLHLYF